MVANESVKFASIQGTGCYSVLKSATDAIGTWQLTLTNVVDGSAWRIELQSGGTLIDSGTVSGGTTVGPLTLPLYSPSAGGNDLRIKVRKGTGAPKYQPFETLATAAAGAQSVYIAQVPDLIA